MVKPYILVYTLLLIFLSGCSSKEVAKPPPVELNRKDSCRICGMIIVDFPGPKAQIHYRDGRIDKFCSVYEMLTYYTQPDRPGGILAIYVNDMSEADWKKPVDHWIDAETAFYVYDPDISGAMGTEIVPFRDRISAERFMKKHGGRIVRFKEITPEMLEPRL